MSQKRRVESAVKQLMQDAGAVRQRRVVVIAGSEVWGCEMAYHLLVLLKPEAGLWVGSSGESLHQADVLKGLTCIPFGQAKQWLGREVDGLVVNAWSGLDVNGFGALSGTLKAGGLLLLVVPPLSFWPDYTDPEHNRLVVYPDGVGAVTGRYLKRFVALIKDNADISVIEEQGAVRFQPSVINSVSQHRVFAAGCCTEAQWQAVEAVKKVAKGHRRRPLVLTADRGRGKSAALGIAAGLLIKEGARRIIATAPAQMATDVLFKHAAEQSGAVVSKPGVVRWHDCELIFKAPDELAEQHNSCDLLLVDEAAAIPAPLLKKLLKAYSRIVFSSTIHGYEGTGRGFSVRFRATLDELTPQWRGLHISEPVRWAANDPLEAFTFDALLLNATPVDAKEIKGVDWREGTVEKLNRDELINDSPLLNELFGLLVLAHYKTTPMDLRHLLDGSNLSVYVLKVKGHVLATALLAHEGGIEETLIDDIWLGKRRVRGHLLPQSLSNHVGLPESVRLNGARVIRIAVHSECQRAGIGQHMISALSAELGDQGIDYIGSLFGSTPELLDFWVRAGFSPVRVGLTREASSGSHSVMMIKPLTVEGRELLQEGKSIFAEQLPYLLAEGLQNLDSGIALRLIGGCQHTEVSLSAREQADIHSFAHGQRLYESCISALKKWVWGVLVTRQYSAALHGSDYEMLVAKVLQNKSWTEVATQFYLTGRSQSITCLRSIIAQCISDQ